MYQNYGLPRPYYYSIYSAKLINLDRREAREALPSVFQRENVGKSWIFSTLPASDKRIFEPPIVHGSSGVRNI